MTFTSHGHHIPGTILAVRPRPSVSRCGGPGLCQVCSAEAFDSLNRKQYLVIPSAPQSENAMQKETEVVENNMTVQTKKFLRKPFEVEAVQVTEENFEDVAAWCGGSIVTVQDTQTQNSIPGVGDPNAPRRFISVEVARPLSRRQTEAYVGDWVLYASKGFKVYANRAFSKNFDEKPEELFVTAEAVQAADAVAEAWP